MRGGLAYSYVAYLKILGGVFAGVHDDGGHAARVLLQVGGHIVDLTLDSDPAVSSVICVQ